MRQHQEVSESICMAVGKRMRINLIGSLSFAYVKLAALGGISECQNNSNGTGQNLDAYRCRLSSGASKIVTNLIFVPNIR